MAIWPFNRKKQDQALPEEVQEYYESGRRQQTGMAWLLALGTLVVTVLLAILLFFGGRWVYQKFASDDEPSQNTTQNQGSAGDSQDSPATSDEDVTKPAATNNQQGTSSTNPSTPSPATSSSTATPSTGSTSSEIPATGPGPDGLQ